MHRSLHLLIYSFILAPLSLAQFPSAPSLVPIASYSGCPPNGPLLPRPTNLALSKHVQAAARNLSSTIDSAVKGEIRAGWPVDNVSFSLAFVTPNGGPGADDGKPIWEHHHRGKENTIKGTNKVTGDSQYMVGSVSKVLTDLVLLRSGVDLQRPVTDFLPELASGNSSIRWRDVTLEALAGHLAGIPPNYVYEFYFLKPLYESLGFPQLNPSDYPSCNVVGLNRDSCTEQEILQGLLSIKPVTPVNSRPLYSQLSLTIASFCLKRATGKNYSQLLQEAVIQPLKLRNTGVSPGDSNRAVIPPGDSSWGSDFGFNAPGGGLFSSTNDLSRFLNAVLDRSVLDTPAQVRKWLQPTSMTSSPTTLVGEPWEILRTTSLVPAHPHTIDIHGKSGGAINYVAQVSLVDQYGVGVVVLTAGPVDSTNILYRAILGTLIPAIDEEARDQSQKYTGTWRTPSTAGNQNQADFAPIELTLSIDEGPGLKIDSLNRNGSSIVDALQTIFLNQYTSVGFGILNSDFRIYPTEIESPVPSDEARALLLSRNSSGTDIINEGLQEYNNVDLIRQDWRINLDIVPLDGAAMSDLAGQNSLSPFCASWQVVDWMHYGGEAMDRVVFVLEKGSGRLVGVEVPSLRGGLLT